MLGVHGADETKLVHDRAVCGNTSETSIPHCPYLRNSKAGAQNPVLVVRLMNLHAVRVRLPSALGQFGLGVEQSIWLGPPF